MVKNLPASAEDTRDIGLILGSGRSSKVLNGTPLQYSCLENPMGRGAPPGAYIPVEGIRKYLHMIVLHSNRRK